MSSMAVMAGTSKCAASGERPFGEEFLPRRKLRLGAELARQKESIACSLSGDAKDFLVARQREFPRNGGTEHFGNSQVRERAGRICAQATGSDPDRRTRADIIPERRFLGFLLQ